MDDQKTEALIRFIRRFATLSAEVSALKSLFGTYVETKTVPVDWPEMLEELRKTQTYTSILQEFEPAIFALRVSSLDENLIAQLLKSSEGKPPN